MLVTHLFQAKNKNRRNVIDDNYNWDKFKFARLDGLANKAVDNTHFRCGPILQVHFINTHDEVAAIKVDWGGTQFQNINSCLR